MSMLRKIWRGYFFKVTLGVGYVAVVLFLDAAIRNYPEEEGPASYAQYLPVFELGRIELVSMALEPKERPKFPIQYHSKLFVRGNPARFHFSDQTREESITRKC